MKKIFLATVLVASLAAQAQKKPAAKTAVKSAAGGAVLKTTTDSLSYAIGVNVANFYRQQGMKGINPTMVAKAINDIVNGKTPLLNDNQANQVMMRFMAKVQEEQGREQAQKAGPTIAAGERFLAENKNKPGVKTTASGLQYEVIKEGTGAKPAATDQVIAHYAGTLIDGTKFDNSYDRGEPITIGLNQVIKGWTEGLQLMSVGSKYRFFIPYQLGYGLQAAGTIPAGSALIFEVELIDIKK
ncbi:FKBP-type peptidyl-prolyl cis-trans isomerase [Flaviaesturariibacter aridisoli]|uniref:Peptidyl-prolyl cis-trans isomerase n=1 Tax=Flaviaesturariibacter aridisoli TaxID=2545761 RepID=A0A4R4E561_9BACT|nr:FKBP-type peptidyl-prolyl cis-trans isomerase [Flaviaesturariibacter aridisoli]TCZ74137.1 FKBP-type peptidyl-prolyl cis-trans isomerase [Flaviaesturariibacter aridisoli]